jgi:hypothetical protein
MFSLLERRRAHNELKDLPVNQVTTIEEAIDQMKAIDALLPTSDGLACFNRMYLQMTLGIQKEVNSGTYYGDSKFMRHLDVVFANMYFDAIERYRSAKKVAPYCWHILLSKRDDPHVYGVQFAMAGMSSHIAHDLPVSLVRACEEHDVPLNHGSHHHDYLKVNKLIDHLEKPVLKSFLPPNDPNFDRDFADVTAGPFDFTISSSRDLAWDNGTALWEIRHTRWFSRFRIVRTWLKWLRHWASRRFIGALDTAASLLSESFLSDIRLNWLKSLFHEDATEG